MLLEVNSLKLIRLLPPKKYIRVEGDYLIRRRRGTGKGNGDTYDKNTLYAYMNII